MALYHTQVANVYLELSSICTVSHNEDSHVLVLRVEERLDGKVVAPIVELHPRLRKKHEPREGSSPKLGPLCLEKKNGVSAWYNKVKI